MRTANKGNEALSAEWIRALQGDARVEELVLLERVPPYTLRFDVAQLRKARSVEALVDSWTQAAIRLEGAASCEAKPLPERVLLDERELQSRGMLMDLKRAVALRSRLARLGRFDSAYAKRMRLVRDCGNLVLNAAGEFWKGGADIPLRHLLDLHFAKALGCRTGIINHTFALTDPTLIEVAKLVYSKLDYISVRDEQSRQKIVQLGVDKERIFITADLVFLTEPAEASDQAVASIALCPSTAIPPLTQHWERLIEALLAKGLSCALCSNDFPMDNEAIERLATRFDLPVVGRDLGYREYAGMLGQFDLVISSRLHTGVLAITALTPVIPVEGVTPKVAAAMDQIKNPFAAIRFNNSDWLEHALRCVDEALASPGQLRSRTAAVAAAQRATGHANVSDVLDSFLRPIEAERATA